MFLKVMFPTLAWLGYSISPILINTYMMEIKEGYCSKNSECNGLSSCHNKHCKCERGLIGPNCEHSTCQNYTECKNGGICYIDQNIHFCACPANYYGRHCEDTKCDPLTNCFGDCHNSKCICHSNIRINGKCVADCNKFNPCQNGGKCTSQKGSYKCECKTGFHGIRCEKEICQKSLCKGFCENNECICFPGSKGKNCETASCSTFNGCFNNGSCKENDNQIFCECDKSRFGGKYCQVECPLQCTHGICGHDKQCYCNDGFEGGLCDRLISDFEDISWKPKVHICLSLLGVLSVIVLCSKSKNLGSMLKNKMRKIPFLEELGLLRNEDEMESLLMNDIDE